MGEWGIALIGAGSAIVGSLVTGWFTLSTARATLNDQHKARALDRRRAAYARFIESAHKIDIAGSRDPGDLTELAHAIVMVELEGSRRVTEVATSYFLCVTETLVTEVERDRIGLLQQEFLAAARDDLQQ
ncbi:hypothetical protein AB0L10_29130 [Streptomyces flaveolus]|uniref:hypothetical protein n=1 Tax=Streptomyces flaveolus TaxID=67297 RepID=UPI0034377574